MSVGEGLLEQLVAWCREQGCVGIDAFALPGHRAAKNFFETAGFTAPGAGDVPRRSSRSAASRSTTRPALPIPLSTPGRARKVSVLRRSRAVALVLALIAAALVTVLPAASAARLPGTTCRVFPADNVWNTRVNRLPVHARSRQWLAAMSSSTTHLHPDYGPAGGGQPPYGIPWQIVSPSDPLVAVHFGYDVRERPRPVPTGPVDSRRGRVGPARDHGEPVDVHALRAVRHDVPAVGAVDRGLGRDLEALVERAPTRAAGRRRTQPVCRSSPGS